MRLTHLPQGNACAGLQACAVQLQQLITQTIVLPVRTAGVFARANPANLQRLFFQMNAV
jgi:hypothetical protein